MGLFDKKKCDICGAKIGLLGNKKLEDGNMCKDCAKKLSHWFEDRRHSTLEEIKQQLAYREQNKQAVANFHKTLEMGEGARILIDENAGKFLVLDTYQDMDDNPDVLNLSDVTDAMVDVDESRTEKTRRDADGNYVSYNPPRYKYSYRFKMKIKVNNPYFDEIEFQINKDTLEIEYSATTLFGVSVGGGFNPDQDYGYRRYSDLGARMVAVLLGKRMENGPAQAQGQNGETFEVVTCPWCGSKTRKTYECRCENCGGNLD